MGGAALLSGRDDPINLPVKRVIVVLLGLSLAPHLDPCGRPVRVDRFVDDPGAVASITELCFASSKLSNITIELNIFISIPLVRM
jgi:hypothetical protein